MIFSREMFTKLVGCLIKGIHMSGLDWSIQDVEGSDDEVLRVVHIHSLKAERSKKDMDLYGIKSEIDKNSDGVLIFTSTEVDTTKLPDHLTDFKNLISVESFDVKYSHKMHDSLFVFDCIRWDENRGYVLEKESYSTQIFKGMEDLVTKNALRMTISTFSMEKRFKFDEFTPEELKDVEHGFKNFPIDYFEDWVEDEKKPFFKPQTKNENYEEKEEEK